MKPVASVRRKFAALVFVVVVIIVVLVERQNVGTFAQEITNKYSSCLQRVESLSTQLVVVNAHRKKLDEVVATQQSRTLELESVVDSLKKDIEVYKNGSSNCSFPTPPSKPGLETFQIYSLKEENSRLKEEIEALQIQVESLKQHKNDNSQRENTTKQQSVEDTAGQARAENEIVDEAKLHPPEEHRGYADGESVHFHRQAPASRDLEFKRHDDLPVRPQILPPKLLVKKLEEKRRQRELGKQTGAGDGILDDGREAVMDYQNLKPPNAQEADYKEMGD